MTLPDPVSRWSAVGRGARVLLNGLSSVAARMIGTRVPATLVALALTGAFFVIGFLGRAYGTHWDEWYHLKVVGSCISRLSLLPDGYSYGGPYFTLGFPVILAHEHERLLGMFHDLWTLPWEAMSNIDGWPSSARFKESALAFIQQPKYLHQVRAVFVGVSAPAVMWAFLATLRLSPRRYGAALAAAAFVAFSWEVGYHARWVAIDAPLLQFCGLELFLFCGAWRAPTRAAFSRWFYAAAAASGLAFACKLNGTFAFLPVLATAALHPGWRVHERLKLAALATVIFLAVSFLFSPAVFLDPFDFLVILRAGSSDYNRGGPLDSRYVSGYVEHISRLAVWFLTAIPSPFLVVALLFSAVAVVGFGALVRKDTRMTIAWLTMIVAFIAVFAHNHVLLVRQYLLFVPFMALCFGQGVRVVWGVLRARGRGLAACFAILVASGMIANGAFGLRRAVRVSRNTSASIADDAAQDLLADKRPVRLAPAALARLRDRIAHAYRCGPANLQDNTIKHILVPQIDHQWMGNRLHAFLHVYGGDEANFDYYPIWFGRFYSERLVDVTIDVVTGLRRDMKSDLDCFPVSKSPGAGGGSPGATASDGGSADR
jgi:hypothetical protein